MVKEKTKVWRLGFAEIGCKDSILTLGASADTTTLIGCYAYLIKRNNEYILVDCGIEDIDTVNKTKSSVDDWKRSETDGDILWNLKRIGVDPKEISKVFITHSHYDHFSGVVHFENAKIYMSQKEYDFLQSEEHAHRKYLDSAVAFIEDKKAAGELVLFDEEYVDGDIKCSLIGGHTVGSMLVYIGNFLFTGDVVYLIENIEKEIPIGFCLDPVQAKKAVSLCKAHKGIILTGHDMKCPVISEE